MAPSKLSNLSKTYTTGDGGDEEDKGESEEQRKKRKQQKHGSHRPSRSKEKPVEIKSQQLSIEEIPREPTPANTNTTLANIATSSGPQMDYDFNIDAVIKDLQMGYRSDDDESSQRRENT